MSLEDKTIQAEVNIYKDALLPIVNSHKDVTGFAFAINGVCNTADIYGSSDLFLKLWPKLLEAASFEALSLYTPKKLTPNANPSLIKKELKDALSTTVKKENSAKGTIRYTGDSGRQLIFETRDQKNRMIHWNAIWK